MGNRETKLKIKEDGDETSGELKTYNAQEMERLELAITNVNSKFPYGTISTESSKQVLPMPTPAARAFCDSLDEYNADMIDFEPMFFWLRRYCSGNMVDKATILFRMFGTRQQLHQQNKKSLFLVLSLLSTPIHMYFNVVGEQANICPQLTPNQKTFITEILQRVFQEKQIAVTSDGMFEPSDFLGWMPKYINRFENTLILAHQEIKRPVKQSSNKEVVRMEKLLKHINRLFPYKTLSFETFLLRFPMPGDFGHRFCAYFDESNSEIIDFAPLTGWLHNYAQADVAQKFKLLFLIFGEGKLVDISEQEMVDVLSVLLMPFTKFFPLHHEPNKVEEAQMPTIGEEESELLEVVMEESKLSESGNPIDTSEFLTWIQRNKEMQTQISGQLGMIPLKRKVQIAPINAVFWSPSAPEIVAGERIRMKLQCNPQVKGGNVRLSFNVPEAYKEFVKFTPSSVVIPQNSDLSEDFELWLHDACPIMPPDIDAIAEGIEGKPNLDDELTEFPLDYIYIAEPTSTLPPTLVDFLRMQFDFATGVGVNYFDEETLATFMLLGHPGTPRNKLAKGVSILLNRFGTANKLYWRGFLQSYQRSFDGDKRQMQKEMELRGLSDDVDTTLPKTLYCFLLFKFQSTTMETNSVFLKDDLQEFMQVGYPDANTELLAKGTQRTLNNYGHEQDGEQVLGWEGFLKLYEASYAKDKKDLRDEFEKRGFTLHKMQAKGHRPRLPSRGSMSNVITQKPTTPRIKRQASKPNVRKPATSKPSGRFQTETVASAMESNKKQPATPPTKAKERVEEEKETTPPPQRTDGCCIIS